MLLTASWSRKLGRTRYRRAGEADRRLKTASNVLGAYQNELLSDRGSNGKKGGENKVAIDLRVSLRSESDAIIDQIPTTRKADI